jgi:hypothetical protein
MRRILLILTVALVMAAMMVASIVPAFAQGRGEGPQGEAKGPEGGNPGVGPQQETVGAKEKQPLPFGGTEPHAGFENAPPGVVCTAPGSPFYDPEAPPCQQ